MPKVLTNDGNIGKVFYGRTSVCAKPAVGMAAFNPMATNEIAIPVVP